MAARLYILYDGRAASGDTDDAIVYTTARSLREARRDKREMFPDAVIFEYEVGTDGALINGRLVE